MMFIVLIIAIIICLLYIGYVKYKEYREYNEYNEPKELYKEQIDVPIPEIKQPALIIAPKFIPSDKWVGSKPGYYYNKSDEGLGYHLDYHPSNPLPPGFIKEK